jgi:pimeloyl-ACP methyl ester carboxylesterase
LNKSYRYYEDHFIKVNGMNIRYWNVGKGNKTVLLLHGLMCSVEEWIYNLPYLENYFRLIAVDLPGHGRNEKPDAPYTYMNIMSPF